jgi:hypothetical protein
MTHRRIQNRGADNRHRRPRRRRRIEQNHGRFMLPQCLSGLAPGPVCGEFMTRGIDRTQALRSRAGPSPPLPVRNGDRGVGRNRACRAGKPGSCRVLIGGLTVL